MPGRRNSCFACWAHLRVRGASFPARVFRFGAPPAPSARSTSVGRRGASAGGASDACGRAAQGEAGVFVPDEGYLRKAQEICKKYNVLLIADEVPAPSAPAGPRCSPARLRLELECGSDRSRAARSRAGRTLAARIRAMGMGGLWWAGCREGSGGGCRQGADGGGGCGRAGADGVRADGAQPVLGLGRHQARHGGPRQGPVREREREREWWSSARSRPAAKGFQSLQPPASFPMAAHADGRPAGRPASQVDGSYRATARLLACGWILPGDCPPAGIRAAALLPRFPLRCPPRAAPRSLAEGGPRACGARRA
jgi:hypothetical protein